MKLLIFFGLVALAYCSKRCAIPCFRNYKRVCGSDGKTYSNECVMRAQSCRRNEAVIAVHDGRCPDKDAAKCSLLCTYDFAPVCGSDGKSYSNECALRGAACKAGKAITITRKADLFDANDDCSKCHVGCPRIYDPVCAHDGKTYDNECLMRSAACESKSPIVAIYQGKCKE